LHQEIVKYLNSSEAKERFFNSGVEAVGSTPQQFAAEIKSESMRLEKVFKAAGIRAG
jgi:tripartite-type tricarboxylate transporter receptor subunit TctC